MTKAVERDQQETLPGVVPKPSKALLNKVEELEAVRYRRAELKEEEGSLEKAVVVMMEKQGVERLALSSGRRADRKVTPESVKVAFTTPRKED